MPDKKNGRSKVLPDKEPPSRKRPELMLLAIAVALLLVTIVLYLVFPRGGGDDIDDDKGPWRDMTKFKYALNGLNDYTYKEISGTQDLTLLTTPSDSLYILIGLEEELASSDLTRIKGFLEGGGKVMVIDDGTNANDLSDFLQGSSGGRVQFTGHKYLVDKRLTDLGDDRGFLYNLNFVKCLVHPDIYYPLEIIAHRPNGFGLPDLGSGMLKCKMNLTVIDNNDNEEMDLEDTFRSYGPVCVEVDIGTNGGVVQYFSTSGIFTDNVMDIQTGGQKNNERFVLANLDHLLPSGGHIYYDPSKQTNAFSPHNEILPG